MRVGILGSGLTGSADSLNQLILISTIFFSAMLFPFMNMAGALAESIKVAKGKAESRGQYLPVVASVCGTMRDPQDFVSQVEQLRKVGVVVMPSNAQAARFAAMIAAK